MHKKVTTCGDHDYLELNVKVKVEEDDDEMEEKEAEQITTGPDESINYVTNALGPTQEFFNLAQLAEVTLAMEGQSEDPYLTARVQEVARRQRMPTKWPASLPTAPTLSQQQNPQAGGTRTMQIVVPENASHIIICTNEGNKSGSSNITNGRDVGQRLGNHDRGRMSKPLQGYTCSDCGKKYSTSSNLARHRQTHRYTPVLLPVN